MDLPEENGVTDAAHIATARLSLRPVRETRAEDLAEALGNYEVVRWLGTVPWPYGVEQAREFLASSNGSNSSVWHIWAGEDLVGGVSTLGDFGFWIARSFWGRGYGPEAGYAAINAHFADPEAPALTAKALADNSRSNAALIRLGFRPDGATTCQSRALGQTLDSNAYRLTRADWDLSRTRFATIAEPSVD